MSNTKIFIQDKQKKEYLLYYKNHFLKNIATLLLNKFTIKDAILLLSSSKNVDDKRKRRKMLTSIYHNIETPSDICISQIISLFKYNSLSINSFNEYLGLNKKDKEYFITIFNNYHALNNNNESFKSIDDFMTKSKYSNIKINYSDELEKIKTLRGFTCEVINNTDTLNKTSMIYKNCWMSSTPFFMNGTFSVINLMDTDRLIGSLRIKSLPDSNLFLAGWVNMNHLDQNIREKNQYGQFSKSLILKLTNEIYIKTGNERFKPENIEAELHYGNNVFQVNELSINKKTNKKSHKI